MFVDISLLPSSAEAKRRANLAAVAARGSCRNCLLYPERRHSPLACRDEQARQALVVQLKEVVATAEAVEAALPLARVWKSALIRQDVRAPADSTL